MLAASLLVASAVVTQLPAQAPKADPDVLVFTNGEQLTGTVEKVDNKNVTFKSLMAGEVTASWDNIKELRSTQTFALLKAKQKLTRKNALASVPSGAVSAEGKDLTLKSPTTSTTVAIAAVDRLVPTADFNKALAPVKLTQGWAGTATGGVSLVRATQNTTTFNGAIALVRAMPQVDWLPPRSVTSLNYTQSYGTTSQTGFDTVKTNIFHAGAERDQYFSPKLFALGDVAFDHNFAQSLDLEQSYGAGVGINLVKSTIQTLDFRGDVHYEKQTLAPPAAPSTTLNIIGSTFAETYLRNLPKKLIFTEFGSISPAWNNTQAYSAHVNAAFGFPVWKGLGFSLSGIDDYLNNAPLGSKKNSTQFITGVTYTIKPR